MAKRLNVLTIKVRRTGYSIEQVYDMTMTVGQLIEALEGYDKDTPVLLNNDNGYTYGEITWSSFRNEVEELDEDEEELDDDEEDDEEDE